MGSAHASAAVSHGRRIVAGLMSTLNRATVEYWLGQWARWMRHSSNRLGYPSRSIGLASGGASEHFDDLVERADHKTVRAVDAAIRSLPLDQQAAIHHVWLAAVFRLRTPVSEVYADALDRLEAEMRKRGVA